MLDWYFSAVVFGRAGGVEALIFWGCSVVEVPVFALVPCCSWDELPVFALAFGDSVFELLEFALTFSCPICELLEPALLEDGFKASTFSVLFISGSMFEEEAPEAVRVVFTF